MGLILLVFLSALILEGLGSYISIVGLASKTSYIIVAVAVTLDFAKITIASVLYKRWGKLPFFLKAYLLPTLICLIIFTSFGAFGYLSQEFSKTVLQQEQNSSQIEDMEKEQAKLEARKIEIDKQISQLPPEFVSQRKRLSDMFAPELQKLQERITVLDKDIPSLKSQNIKESGTNGTISSAAKNIGISPESIIRVVSFFLVLFIDPLAIILLTMGNFLVEERKREAKKAKIISSDTQDSLSIDTSSQDPITLNPDDLSPTTKSPGQKKRSKKEKIVTSVASFENNEPSQPEESLAPILLNPLDAANKSEPVMEPVSQFIVHPHNVATPTSPPTLKKAASPPSLNNSAPEADIVNATSINQSPSSNTDGSHDNSEAKNNIFVNYLKKEEDILTLSVQADNNATNEVYFIEENSQPINSLVTPALAPDIDSLDSNDDSSQDNSFEELEEFAQEPALEIVEPIANNTKPVLEAMLPKTVHTPLENKSSNPPVVLPGQVVQRNKPVGKFDFKSFKEKPVADNSDLAQMAKYIKEKQKNTLEEDPDSSPI